MITSREHYTDSLFTITDPIDLSSKPGVVLASVAHYETNYMSIPGDKWVSSKGTILTCEQLFDALSKRDTDTDTKLVWLSDYDFQHMYETDLTAQYVRMGRIVEEQEVPVYDPHLDVFTNRLYSTLLETGTVLHVKGTLWMIVRNDSQWGAVSKENKLITLLRLERLIRAEGFGVAVCIPEDYDN